MTREQWADVQELADREEGMSEWEMQFIGDLMDKGPDYNLSDKQAKCLERIVNK